LFWKLNVSFSLVIVVCMLAVGGYLVRSQRHMVQRQLVDELERSAVLVRERFAPLLDFDRLAAADSLADALGRSTGARLTLIAPDGRVLADSEDDPARMENHRFRPEVADALRGRRGWSLRRSATTGERYLYVAIPSASPPGWVVRVALPFEQYIGSVRAATNLLIAGSVLAGVLAVLLSLFFTRRITQPLDAMRDNLRRIEAGELGVRLDPGPQDEVGQLARSLNQAQERLEQTIQNLVHERNERDVILASMSEGLLAVDAEDRILLMNAAARALLGLDVHAVEGRPLVETVRHPDLVRFVAAARTATRPVSAQVVLHGVQTRWLDLHGAPLRLHDTTAAGAVVVFGDVTRLIRLEQARKDFVANVSHELKTPVTAIQGFLETLLEGGALHDADAARNFLGKIARQTERLSSLIDDLLYLARLEHEGREIPRRPVNLAGVVEDSLADLEPAARARGVTLSARLGDTPQHVMGDAGLLRRAVDNLVDNAIKYSPAGAGVEVQLSLQEGMLHLEVRDHGPGIPAQHLPRITERFYRVDTARSRALGGTGLGLAIVKHVALAHRGELQVESTVGQGSVFRLRLPVAPDAGCGL
jgi:two-component system phosphate regulon sensor histidine kinase PhoR